MIDLLMTTAVVLFLVLVTTLISARTERELRPWVWAGLLEYLLCTLYQYYHGADANGYRQVGTELANMLDANFSWAWHETFALMIQAPSAYDDVIVGAHSNTGSMFAASAFIIFFVRGSGAAAQALVTGLAYFGALGIHRAFRDAWPTAKPFHLFFATVLFPSVAFWVSALHKEAFCLMGMGLALLAWRKLFHGNVISAFLLGLPGLTLIASFRPPVLAPLFLGLTVHFVLDRIQRQGRKVSAGTKGVYVMIGVLLFAFGAVVISTVAPEFGIARISQSVTMQQTAWQQIADEGLGGGSAFDQDEPIIQTPAQQIASAPYALFNALFRPQLFDVHSPNQLVSALEMTAITIIVITSLRRLGLRPAYARIRSSPFLTACALVTLIGGTFLGVTTRNFGTLARYRVPFLPFYGCVLVSLLERKTAPAGSPASPAAGPVRRRIPVRRRVGAAAGAVSVRTENR